VDLPWVLSDEELHRISALEDDERNRLVGLAVHLAKDLDDTNLPGLSEVASEIARTLGYSDVGGTVT
jgi:hypothetical protein